MRLDRDLLEQVPATVAVPRYDRTRQAVGIVHFGIGAFHRAHQAWYTELCLDRGERDWAILGVSLRSADVAAQLNPQDGLYTLAERSADGESLRVIGAVKHVLVAPDDPEAVVAALASPEVRIASFTITEKGYCRAVDGSLDFDLAREGSVYRFLAEGLRRRRDTGLPGLTLLSCDNLAHNGRQLDRLLRQYLDRHDPGLVAWYGETCTCPSTMIDRIVPATTPADRAHVAAVLGMEDHGAVMTERFSQWVIEDRFAGPRPGWEQAGAQLVDDVEPYETAKLRMLNGAHSALAYLGLERGHAYVHQAVADPELRPLIERLMLQEAAPTIAAAPGQDLAAYAEALLARFANPSLQHRLIQIAMDGSQKIPQRWLETLTDNQRVGRSCPAILAALGAWLRHVRGLADPVNDPLADELAALWLGRDQGGVAAALFGPGGRFAASWTADAAALSALAAAPARP